MVQEMVLFLEQNRLLHSNGGIVGAVHSVTLEKLLHRVRAKILQVVHGIHFVFDTSNSDLVDSLRVNVKELDEASLLHLPGHKAYLPIVLVLVDVDPRSTLGHLPPVLWVQDRSKLALIASEERFQQDLGTHPMTVADGVSG